MMMGCASVPKPDQCEANNWNHFENAAVLPGPSAIQLSKKFASVNDYGNHPTGWLAQRLYPLEDDFQISGEVVNSKGCVRHVPEDNDREFYVKLSDESYRRVATYFDPPETAPHYILVEMIGDLSPRPNAAVPFKTWRVNDDSGKVQFTVNDAAPHGMTVDGSSSDWALIGSRDYPYVAVRGALVVDISNFHAGTGDLEIHPGEMVRLSSTPVAAP